MSSGVTNGRDTPADDVERPLDPRVIELRQRVGLLVSAFLAAGSAIGLLLLWLANGEPPRTGLMVLTTMIVAANGALGWHMQRWPRIAYRYTRWRVNEQGIEIRRGVLWRVVINVPRSRVQHTDVSQGPLERGYGLGTLVIYTAGTDHARVTLSGLDYATALAVREHLLPAGGSDAV